MPSSRVTKSRSSTTRRQSLAKRLATSSETMRPCNECVARSLVCRVGPESSKCSECVTHTSRKCDLVISESEWARVQSERTRLRAEVKASMDRAQAEMARLSRLQKQQNILETRWEEMVRREFQNIEELEADEARASSEATIPSLDDFLLNVSFDHVEVPPWPATASSTGIS